MNDVSGREPRAAVPLPNAVLPGLSPAFATEEDAACWVHDRIPAAADREYGSVILRTPNGDFVATEPKPGETNRYDFRTILAIDAHGNYLHPQGYTCVANVHSHPPAHDKVREANPGKDEAVIRLFINFFSDMDFIADVSERTFFRSAYLSGPDEVLLKYSPSGSKEEFSYYLWLKAGSPPGNPVGGFGVENIIRKVASVGELKVIVSNADWGGSIGKVPSDWQPGKAFAKGVISELPLMTSICANAELAVLAALKPKGALTSGLVLKKSAGDDYVATRARPAGRSSWDPSHFFPRGDDNQLKLPSGYVLEGLYYASRSDPALYPSSQPWLYENFFTPGEMALAIACQALSKPLLAADRPLSLYMQAKDCSMLKYSFSGSEVETALSVENPDGSISDGGLQTRMQAGTLRPREFVSVLALAGRLEVLRGSPLWDRLGPVGLDWVPYADFQWPTMSPAFLSADDAARYVHARVGSRRDRQYAGYIFQRSDKRFTATEPLEGGIDSLSLGTLYPRDNAGHPVLPDEHVVQGRYVSHQALSMLDPMKAQRLKWTRQEAALSLQMFSVEEVRQVFLDEMPLYLSGAQNSLIKFEPSMAVAGQALVKRLGTGKHPGPLVAELDAGVLLPSGFIREQAAAGRLTVVMNSELWGPRGQVTEAWSAATGAWEWKRPEQVAFGAIFSSADEAAEDQYNRDVRLHDLEKAWFGFILKHNDREEYVATELVPNSDTRNDVFKPQNLFGVTRVPPYYQYPEGFHRHAFFYSRQHLKHSSVEAGSWLTHYFIVPDDLYSAVYYSRRRPVVESPNPIPLYISTQDGALLKFDNRKGNKLFDDDTPQMGLGEIKANLSSGKLQPQDFVLLVANHGGLTVMRTSALWDRPWPVDRHWLPFMNLQRQGLSPLFHSPDDAVIYARSRFPAEGGRLFGGVILVRSDGLYLTTDPMEVSREDFDLSEVFPQENIQYLLSNDCRVTGRYRTRVPRELPVLLSEIEKQTYRNMLSVDTLYTAFKRPEQAGLDEYLFASDGSLIRYRTGLLSRLWALLNATFNDYQKLPGNYDGKVIKERIHDGTLNPSAWVDSLAKSGDLQVVTGGRFWGGRGTVTGWPPSPAALPQLMDDTKAVNEPACSPVFSQESAVARHVHEAAGDRAAQAFGFILRRTRNRFFSASLPVETRHSRMALDRVFPQGTLPDGHAMQAVYISAQYPRENDPDVGQFFLPPLDVHYICAAADTPQGYRPVYFSCADGALLRYEMNAFEPGEFYDEFGEIQLRKNTFASLEQATRDASDVSRGRFDLPSYIQRMARAGKLEVIVTSQYWSRHGVVDENWQPRRADVSAVELWAANPEPTLGPVFHHADDAARYVQQRASTGDVFDSGFESAILSRTLLLIDAAPCFVPIEPLARSASGDNPMDRIFRTANDRVVTRLDPLTIYPAGFKVVASHQLYLSGNTTLAPDIEQVYANFTSPFQVHAHTHALLSKGFMIKDYYYSTPHGVLIRYTPANTLAEKGLLLKKQAVFSGGKWEAGLSPGEFISQLIDLGDFRVLIAGTYWRQVGRMGTKWRERRQQPPATGIVRNREEL